MLGGRPDVQRQRMAATCADEVIGPDHGRGVSRIAAQRGAGCGEGAPYVLMESRSRRALLREAEYLELWESRCGALLEHGVADTASPLIAMELLAARHRVAPRHRRRFPQGCRAVVTRSPRRSARPGSARPPRSQAKNVSSTLGHTGCVEDPRFRVSKIRASSARRTTGILGTPATGAEQATATADPGRRLHSEAIA